jgi:TetR/AcrR family transcriptional regulator
METKIDAPETAKKTRIQVKREKLILDCALEVFANYGFHGATIDQIADKADISKPNLLYYFRSKEHIYLTLLERTMEGWLDPFFAINPEGEPLAELEKYIESKMQISFSNPLASRLFAQEVQNGAPRLREVMENSLRGHVDAKAAVIQKWMDDGKLRYVDPHHLIFSIWSVTQHYADFAVQIDVLLEGRMDKDTAMTAVKDILLRGLKP